MTEALIHDNFEKQIGGRYVVKLKWHIPYDPATALLGTYIHWINSCRCAPDNSDKNAHNSPVYNS